METNPSYYTGLITRYFCGEATPEEIQELERWVRAGQANATIFSEYRKTWKIIENDRIASSINLDREWKDLSAKLTVQEVGRNNTRVQPGTRSTETEPRIPRLIYYTLRIAAVFLLLAVPSFFLYEYLSSPADKQLTASAEMVEQTLPDGTHVTLNAGATLSYPSRFEGSFRNVVLKGEAWFEVARDASKPFIIASENIRVRVVGTSFLVNTHAPGDTKEIILTSGIVKVYYENRPGETVMLLPGEKAELHAGGGPILKTNNQDMNFLAWKTKRMVFNNTPLNEVAGLISKVYHTSIRLSDDRLSDCRITATFDRQSLESVLNVLKATLDLQVHTTGAGINLSGHGCDQTH